MSSTYRVGVVGLVHDHVWSEIKHWAVIPHVELVAVADAHPPLLERAQSEFGIDQTFDDVGRLFDECELDVVQVCTANSEGADVIEQAAARGIHAVVEKPMAATLEQADRMLAAVENAGTQLMLNWPFRWRANTTQAWRLLQDGAIGHVFNARVRMAHKGPREFGCSDYFCDWLYDASRNGAGAIIDYCSYGAVAFRLLFGMPNAVQGVAARLVKTDMAVDDNAAITLIYDDRFAQAEASWCQISGYHDAVYYGTSGTLWTDEGTIWIAREDGAKEEILVEPLPEGERNGPEYFIGCLDRNETPSDVCAANVGRDAQAILQAGLDSAQSGRRIELT
jgi:predicted dehydrogenase